MAVTESLILELSAKVDKYRADIKNSQKDTETFQKNTSNAFNVINRDAKTLGAGMSSVSVNINKASDSIDNISASSKNASESINKTKDDVTKLGSGLSSISAKALSGIEADAKIANTSINKVTDAVRRGIAENSNHANSFIETNKRVKELNKNLSQADIALQEFVSEQKVLGRTVNDNNQVLNAQGKVLVGATRDYLALSRAAKQADTVIKSNTKNLAGLGRQTGQAAVQVEQFIGSVAGGQNPMRAFAYQAADMGIVLGAPLVGAIVGVSASIASLLLPALFDAGEDVKELTDRLKALRAEGELTQSQAELLAKVEKQQNQERRVKIKSLNDEIKENESLIKTYEVVEKSTRKKNEQDLKTIEQLNKLRDETLRLKDERDALEKVTKESTNADKKYLDMQKQINDELSRKTSGDQAFKSSKALGNSDAIANSEKRTQEAIQAERTAFEKQKAILERNNLDSENLEKLHQIRLGEILEAGIKDRDAIRKREGTTVKSVTPAPEEDRQARLDSILSGQQELNNTLISIDSDLLSIKQKSADAETQIVRKKLAEIGQAEIAAREKIKSQISRGGSRIDAIREQAENEANLIADIESGAITQREAQIQAYNMREIASLQEHYAKTLELGGFNREQVAQLEADYFSGKIEKLTSEQEQILAVKQQYSDAETAIIKKQAQTEAAILKAKQQSELISTTGAGGRLLSAISNISKKGTEIQKTAAKGAIVANTLAGMMRQYADLPYPAAVLTKAAIALEGAAAYSAVDSGSAPSSGGSTAIPSTTSDTQEEVPQFGVSINDLSGGEINTQRIIISTEDGSDIFDGISKGVQNSQNTGRT